MANEDLTEEDFRKRYRFTKFGFQYILNLLKDGIQEPMGVQAETVLLMWNDRELLHHQTLSPCHIPRHMSRRHVPWCVTLCHWQYSKSSREERSER